MARKLRKADRPERPAAAGKRPTKAIVKLRAQSWVTDPHWRRVWKMTTQRWGEFAGLRPRWNG